MFLRSARNIVAALALTLFVSSSAFATAIVDFDFNETGPELELAGGILSTVDDLVAGTTGEQNSNLNFIGALGGLADIAAGASVTIDGIAITGTATVAGPLVSQGTSGGTFALYDPANTLLLGGSLTAGVISGSSVAGSGAFFSTAIGSFTGGSLLGLLNPGVTAELALVLSGVNGGQGMSVVADELQDFTANGVGTLSAVPEPATLLLLSSGLMGLGGAIRRRL